MIEKEKIYQFSELLSYKMYVEDITDNNKLSYCINSLCEVSELEFLSRLPKNMNESQIESFIDKLSSKYSVLYDSKYLVSRWKKIFRTDLYCSTNDAKPYILERDRNICQYCNNTSALEVHHVIPRDPKKYNGVDSYYNLVLACKTCNLEISNSIVLPKNWWILHSDSKYVVKS